MAVYAITVDGAALGARLHRSFPQADLFIAEKWLGQGSQANGGLANGGLANGRLPGLPLEAKPLAFPLGPELAGLFARYDCHVFIVSVGAVVRLIAPLLQNKLTDPAVVCVDDAGRVAVSVLSGHLGRGNEFTHQVARALGAQPVITTASDAQGTLTVDILGREFGWSLDDPSRNVTGACSAVVNRRPVLVVQLAGETGWWPADKPLPPGVVLTHSLEGVDPQQWEALVVIADLDIRESHPAVWQAAVIHRPKSLVLGIGCDKNTPADLVQRGVQTLLERHHLAPASVKGLATIDLKQEEPALLALSAKMGWPLVTYPARQLAGVQGIETPSAMVQKHTGTPGVAEPACLLAAGADKLLVAKQTYTEEGAGRSMTFAAARLAAL